MPVLYHIDPTIHLIYYAGFGHCTGQELLLAESALKQSPLREPLMSILIDLQAVTHLDIDKGDYQQSLEMNLQRLAQGEVLEPTALVIRKPLDATMIDVYTIFVEPDLALKMGSFYTLSAALDWLGLAPHAHAITGIRQALQAQYWHR